MESGKSVEAIRKLIFQIQKNDLVIIEYWNEILTLSEK